MVDWKKLQSYDLTPVRARIRIERKWEKKKEGHWLPDGILPPGSTRRKLFMTKYLETPMETKQEFPLDPNTPSAVYNLFKFCSKKYPKNTWYLVDLWLLNEREGSFKDHLLHFHYSTIQKDPKLGNIKGLKLHKIDDKDALLFDVSPTELENADNGYADDKCKRRLEAPMPVEAVHHTAACGLF